MNESYRHYTGERSQTQNKKWFHIFELLEQRQWIYIDSNRISSCPDWETWMKPDCKKDWGNFLREIEVVIICCIQLSKWTNYRLKLWILKYINYTSEGWLEKTPPILSCQKDAGDFCFHHEGLTSMGVALLPQKTRTLNKIYFKNISFQTLKNRQCRFVIPLIRNIKGELYDCP